METHTADTIANRIKFDCMVDTFMEAKMRFDNSRPGSPIGKAAEKTMEDLVAKAERLGFMDAFVKEVTK